MRRMIPTSFSSKFQGVLSMNALRCYVSEFISTFFFVLAAVGSVMSSSNYSVS